MARIFITGSSDGLGLLSARKLVATGHQVVLHARNDERAEFAISQVPDAEKVLIGDLSSIKETRQLAESVNELGTFNAIIHNAGIYQASHDARTEDGLPLLFAVNSLAPYILTAMINRPERLIYLSSGMHLHGDANEGRLESIIGGNNVPGYSDTKLHDVLLAFAVARKWRGVISNAVDPGWVPTKMGGRNAPDNLDEGYETQVWLAVGKDEEAIKSRRYLHHKKEARLNPQANDQNIQDKFLSVCEKLTDLII